MISTKRALILLLVTPLLTQCGSFRPAPQTQSVTGPFDSRGNYVEDWVDKPEKWYRPPTPGTESKTEPQIASNTLPEPEVPLIETTSPPPPTRTSPTNTTPKPKPKPQPSVVRYTVKRGDTLSVIATRYKTTVTKIRSANALKGTVIRPGQVLKIPR